MAKPKAKKADQPAWSRRQFNITTAISLDSLLIGLGNFLMTIFKPSPPVQVIVQAPPPAPTFVAAQSTTPWESLAIAPNTGTLRMTTRAIGKWWEDPATDLFQARHTFPRTSHNG